MYFYLDDLRGAAIQALLQEHLDAMHQYSPPESVHALDLTALQHPSIRFWSAWADASRSDLLGCGALKALDSTHAELKSMRTSTAHLRQGVARALLLHLVADARLRGIERISLETGTPDQFEPARLLYASEGFVKCGPFAGYIPDQYSCFMTKVM